MRQITPAQAVGSGVWTRDYFRAAARQRQSNFLIPALIAIGLGSYFISKDSGASQPTSTQNRASARNTSQPPPQ